MGKRHYQTVEEAYEAGRRHYVFSIKSDIRYWENSLKTGKDAFGRTLSEERIAEINQTLAKLYVQLSDEKAIDHEGRSWTYGWKKIQPHKDNSGHYVISSSDTAGRLSCIRVPSLKRKTAWKRFYKMFPGLKGQSVITGYSSTYAVPDLHSSTIKLKKI